MITVILILKYSLEYKDIGYSTFCPGKLMKVSASVRVPEAFEFQASVYL